MNTNKISNELAIKITDSEWRLVVDRADGLTLLAAEAGKEVITYRPEFARARRLPESGELAISDVEEVVLGWSQNDRAWRLGLLLSADIAHVRGGRWCELMRWADVDVTAAVEEARSSGQALADVLGAQFRFVPAPVMAQAEAAGSVSTDRGQAAPARQVRSWRAELPADMGPWRLRRIDVGLQWEHTSVWSLARFWAIVSRIVLGIVFIVLSVLTLQSPYAAVQPDFLPYVGIVIGIGMILSGLRVTLKALRTEAVVIDLADREVRRHLDLTSDVVESYDFDEIEAVVVTQMATARIKGRNGQPDRMTHEAWLHLLLHEARQIPGKERRLKPEDRYVTIGYAEGIEGDVVDSHFEGPKRSREPMLLHPEDVTTPAQHVAMVIAQTIRARAYIDQR